MDTVGRLLEELCRPGAAEKRRDGEHHLREYVDAEGRDLGAEAYGKFNRDVYKRVDAMLRAGNEASRRLGGVLAIDELIDVRPMVNDAVKSARLGSLLSGVLADSDEQVLVEQASRTLGKLVKGGGALTSDIVEREIKRALTWCEPRSEVADKRLTALTLLRELAEQAPAVFNVHVKSFVDAIWYPLRDVRPAVREAAVQALKACLKLVADRETRYRVQWYYKLFQQTMRGLNRDPRSGAAPSPEAIHGSLLALAELLQHTGEFLLARYKEVVETVLRYKDSKEKLIRRAVIVLLPRMATFSPERFTSDYLSRGLGHLIGVLRNPAERGVAFTAIADIASALATKMVGAGPLEGPLGGMSAFEVCLPALAGQIRDCVGLARQQKGRVACSEALHCAGVLASALRGAWRTYCAGLLEGMVQTGLSEVLVTALISIAAALPDLLEDIQLQLLDLLSLALAKRPFSQYTPRHKVQALNAALAIGELQGPALTKLALHTLGTFDFGQVQLLEFIRDHILAYTDDADKEIRQAAVLACAKVLERFAQAMRAQQKLVIASQASLNGGPGAGGVGAHDRGGLGGGIRWPGPPPPVAMTRTALGASWGGLGGDPPPMATFMSVRSSLLVEKVAHRLLVAAVADPSERVRVTVLRALQATDALDEVLAQADFLRALFVALNDESCHVRELAIKLAGRLGARNPAYVNPALRRHLLQLLTDMEHSPDGRLREEAAYLLEQLISAAPRLITPYVSPIHKALVAKLRGPGPAVGGLLLGSGAMGHLPLKGHPGASLHAGPHGGQHGAHSTHMQSLGHGGGGLGGSAVGGGVLGSVSGLKEERSKLLPGGGALAAGGGGRLDFGGVSEGGGARTVLSTLGQLAAVSQSAFRPYVSEVLPLMMEAIQDSSTPARRLAAVRALGKISESTGTVMSPYMDFPQLLAVLLRMMHESTLHERKDIMKVLGIVGALDPHTHKTNIASLSGEGKLEKEGVRPLRHGGPTGAGEEGGGGLGEGGAGAGAPDDFAASTDLLPASGLMTSSEEYYPTVAINALVRLLRDPSLTTQHAGVVAALMDIFKALQLAAVQFLPKVLPVLFAVMNSADEGLRIQMLGDMTQLVHSVRQHMRRFLPDLLGLVHRHWTSATAKCLELLRDLSSSLRDDFRAYVPELLPKFVALITESERSMNYDHIRGTLGALEALGCVLEEHLHLLLPALTRLLNPTQPSTPLELRRLAIRSMRRLLPRMQVAGYASAVLHPLIKVLNGPHDELRRDALDAICSCAVLLGADFAIFVPVIRKSIARYRLGHEWFERLALASGSCLPPCMSEAEDWEASSPWAAEIDGLSAEQAAAQSPAPHDPALPAKLVPNPTALRRAWESSQRVTKEDWAEWIRHFSVELLRESPSPALRACHLLAQVHPSMARELFAAGFVSCWGELDAPSQEQLVRSLEAALAAPTIPPEIVTSLLNLAEFMEHDDKRLPLDTRTLGALAEKCHAFAKALHYKEMEFQTSPQTAIEALIHINNQLRQPEAAVGVLTYAQKHLHMELKESWYEKLCRWEDAKAAYERRLRSVTLRSHDYYAALLGKMRCLAALAEWTELHSLCCVEWDNSEPHMRREMAMISAHAAWHKEKWVDMAKYVEAVDPSDAPTRTATGAFLRAVLLVKHGRYDAARSSIDTARDLMATEFTALVGESYERAYTDMVRLQQLTELEEVIEIKQHQAGQWGLGGSSSLDLGGSGGGAGFLGGLPPAAAASAVAAGGPTSLGPGSGGEVWDRPHFIKQLWRDRLKGVQRNVEVWQSLFSVRSLVVRQREDVDAWLKFAALCRKSGRTKQALLMLHELLGYDPLRLAASQPGYGAGSGAPHIMLAFLKHCWLHIDRKEALARLRDMVRELPGNDSAPTRLAVGHSGSGHGPITSPAAALAAPLTSPTASVAPNVGVPARVAPDTARTSLGAVPPQPGPPGAISSAPVGPPAGGPPRPGLRGRAYLRLGLWTWALNDRLEGPGVIPCVMSCLQTATEANANWAKAWHQWALFNVAVMQHHHGRGEPDQALRCVAPAVSGFFRSVALGQASGDRTGNLQDILRLLTLWFNHGHYREVEQTLQEGFSLVSIDTWLVVIPQIIARIHTSMASVRSLIHQLLVKIGRHHPQALMYPLLVATKSQSVGRRTAANGVLEAIRQHSPSLVEQAQLVSKELIRMAILWHERWHEGLEDASRQYFGEQNPELMLQTLIPLHQELEHPEGPATLKEIAFINDYGRELSDAYEWLNKYRVSRKEAELHQAWDLYYHVFKRINKQLHSLTTLELQYVAPALVRAQGMELAVPGTYIAGEPLVTIAAFAPQLHVIASKQRPRKLTIYGGDGAEYMFLLKGHEDLRQDERVMQLFGLVNTMLSNDRATAERDLSIARYAVIPLSPNSGLIGWVPNCDTLHALIREYREAKKQPLNLEHRLMLGMAPDYDHLMVIQKVEVFEFALDSTSGEDLHKVLWLKSRNSEVWLDRRTNYTRSAAVMSMVGYILGLGDRHPSNLMLDRYSGKLLHIDFGDCFEASMTRDKFPEKVPFRLTRMMVKAMEVSGLEGNFRTTCENVMRVLRSNKESVTAMLEAFVHDPLINWRLLNAGDAGADGAGWGLRPPVAGGGIAATAGGEAAAGEQPGGAAARAGGARGGAAMPSPPRRETRERELRDNYQTHQLAGDATEVLNTRAVAVMTRMSDKLMGRDYVVEGMAIPQESDSVSAQVQRLIGQATSHENLCQSYIGWCPFW